MLLERTVTERATAGEARKRLTDILLSRGLKEEAVRLIMEAPNPDIAQILQASKLQEELGDLGRAEELLRRGIRGYEGDPEIKNQLAWFLTQNGGDLEEALRLADAAVKWDGYDPYFRDTRAVILTRLGRGRGGLRAGAAGRGPARDPVAPRARPGRGGTAARRGGRRQRGAGGSRRSGRGAAGDRGVAGEALRQESRAATAGPRSP
jgi:tetratricopeptide (TPR) repeat protein